MLKLNYPKFWQLKNSLLSFALLPFSAIFYLLTKLRSFSKKTVKFSIPITCIGNINVGGTGKTQMALHIAKILKSKGCNPCIVTKGFGRSTNDTRLVNISRDNVRQTGDEAYMLAHYFPVIIYKNLKNARSIINNNDFDVAIFDDGMQNAELSKDLTILMVDGLRGFGNERLLPAGPLRESIKTISQKADLAVIVGADRYNAAAKVAIFKSFARISALTTFAKEKNYIAFAGIGNPEKFYFTLKEMGLNIIETHNFPDHYNYTIDDVIRLYNLAEQSSSTLITTEKDWVKIPHELQDKVEYVRVALKFDDEKLLQGLLNEKILKKIKARN
jgi:tetraacyldisaccharide 4'-kinase